MTLIQWLRNLAKSPNSQVKKTKSWRTVPSWRRSRLGLERLEERLAPTATPTQVLAYAASTTVTQYTLRDNSGNLELIQTGNPAIVLASQALAGTNSVVITGHAGGSDTLTLDFSNGAFGVPVSFDGGGSGTLNVNGGTFASITDNAAFYTPALHGHGNLVFTPTAGTDTTIAYSGLAPITITSTATDKTINLPAGVTDAILQNSGTSGMETISATSGAFESITFTDPTGTLFVTAAAGAADKLNVKTLNASFDANLSIDLTANTSGTSEVDFTGANTLVGAKNITAKAQTITDVGALVTGAGTIAFTASNSLSLAAGLTATGGTVTLTDTSGSIAQTAGTITATNLALSASTGIGTIINPIVTQVSNLVAQTNTGGIFVGNTGDLTIGFTGDPFQGVNVGTSGDIVLTDAGSVNVTTNGEVITGPANLTITANGAAANIQTAGFQAAVFTTGPGTLALTAGQDVILGFGNSYGNVDAGNTSTTINANAVVHAGRDLIVQGTGVSYLDASGPTGSVTATAGRDINLVNGNAEIFTQGNGPIALTAGRAFNDGSGPGNSVDTVNGDITITAATMSIQSAVQAGTGIVTLQQNPGTEAITLGTTVAGTLSLLPSDLSNITAGALRIGNAANAGGITVTAAIASNGNFNTLDLLSGGTVSETGTGSLSVPNLAVQAAGGASLATNASAVSNLAAKDTAGGFSFLDSQSLTITTVDGVTGLTAAGNVTVSAAGALAVNAKVAGTGSVSLTATDLPTTGQDLTVAAGVPVSGSAVTLRAGDNVTIVPTAQITATGAIVVTGDFGNTDAIGGTVITFSGATLTATSTTVNGGIFNDTFNVNVTISSGFANFLVDGGSGTNTLNVTDLTGGGVLHDIPTGPAKGYVTTDYSVTPGALHSQVQYKNIGTVTPSKNANVSYVEALVHQDYGRNASRYELDYFTGVLQFYGRQAVVSQIENSGYGVNYRVDRYVRDVTGQPATAAQVQQGRSLLLQGSTEEAMLTTLFANTPYQGIDFYGNNFRSQEISFFYQRLFRQSPSMAVLSYLVNSGSDLRTIRESLETDNSFYFYGI